MESAIAVGIFALFVLIGASSDFAGAYRGYQEGRKFTNSVLDGSNHFYVRYRDFVHTTADEHVMAEYEQETLARLCKAASVEENDCTPEWYLTSDIRREYLLQDYRDTVWRMLIIMPLAICYLLVMFYLYVDREKVGEREQSG